MLLVSSCQMTVSSANPSRYVSLPAGVLCGPVWDEHPDTPQSHRLGALSSGEWVTTRRGKGRRCCSVENRLGMSAMSDTMLETGHKRSCCYIACGWPRLLPQPLHQIALRYSEQNKIL